MSSALKKMTLKEQAYQVLREMIASHRFSPGKKINIERIAKELGVSRTPIWQALQDMEGEGLVKYVPNQGILMAEMTVQMALELYEVREVLEGMAARLTAERISDEALRLMEASFDAQVSMVKDKDIFKYSQSDFHFHELIYDSCGNWLLKELLANIKNRSRPFICDISPILPGLLEDHSRLIEAFGKKDQDSAEKIIREHNRRMANQIRDCQRT